MERIYLDNNATTPLDPEVLDAVKREMTLYFGNPSSMHYFGQQSQGHLVEARHAIAKRFGVKSNEIVFTSGATESVNMVLKGFFESKPSGHVISSSLEHSCVFRCLEHLKTKGVSVSYLSGGKHGAVRPEQVEKAITKQTRLICLIAVNNETGVKTDIEAIAAIAERENIPLIVDGVALLGKDKFTIPSGVSAMCFSGHKIHGPKGIGFAIIRKSLKLTPLLMGGIHEGGRRAGTENIYGIVGIAKAVDLVFDQLSGSIAHMLMLRKRFEENLWNQLSDLKLNGDGPRICNTSNIAFLGIEGETLLANLDREGVAASHGSACTSGGLEPSRILLNMEVSPEDARSSIRFSFSRMNKVEEIDGAVCIIVNAVNRLRERLRRL